MTQQEILDLIEETNYSKVPTRSKCQNCKKVMVLYFIVPNELWYQLIKSSERSMEICIDCFASKGDEKMIDWSKDIKFYPLPFVKQVEVQEVTPKE